MTSDKKFDLRGSAREAGNEDAIRRQNYFFAVATIFGKKKGKSKKPSFPNRAPFPFSYYLPVVWDNKWGTPDQSKLLVVGDALMEKLSPSEDLDEIYVYESPGNRHVASWHLKRPTYRVQRSVK